MIPENETPAVDANQSLDILLTASEAKDATRQLLDAAALSANEEQLKIRCESVLEGICREHGIFWNSYTYEHSFNSGSRRVDVVHGSTIIEYEPPRSFKGTLNAQLRHARKQLEEYVELLSAEEGRELSQYSLVAWDGETMSYGLFTSNGFVWEIPRPFDDACLTRLVSLIADGGRPLVSPMLLRQLVGPDTEVGRRLVPALFNAVMSAEGSNPATRTKLIYTEWARLFGQVDGVETDRLAKYLGATSLNHGVDYRQNPQAYVFALSTYIAIVAKVSAVFALAARSGDDFGSPEDPRAFLSEMEEGQYFQRFGIKNMLGTDFFSWYLGSDVSVTLEQPLSLLLERLHTINFDVTLKNPKSVRDLFKGLYMEFTPAPMRHALGEYYTPDWLASHVLDISGWLPGQSMLDPTCGSGTFLLECLRRRLETAPPTASATDLLNGINGFDLNPLAVLTARASIVVFLSERFNPDDPVLLPVFLADAINTAEATGGVFTHSILTEKGERSFAIPVQLAESDDFFKVMEHLRVCVDSGLDSTQILSSLTAAFATVANLSRTDQDVFERTIRDLVDLHLNHWNGIWCLVLFDRIKAGCIADVNVVAGNPPWVKWSNLPRQYGDFIKPLCDRMDIFSEDNWVGGIQSDISTVVTYHALERFVQAGGTLAFLITGTVFKNESSQGFRRWELQNGTTTPEPMSVEIVEDYGAIRPFEGVNNWPTLLVIRRNGLATKYPVKYRKYKAASGTRVTGTRSLALYEDLQAMPVPGTDSGPWLVGKKTDLPIWEKLFRPGKSNYQARKGITTDANGIFFVDTHKSPKPGIVRVTNDPTKGRRSDITKKSMEIEHDDVFPLLRGRDVSRFNATPEPNQGVIVPQRGMFGDETLPTTKPSTFQFLSKFKPILESRSSYKRFQQGKPFWSVWSTGDYTFAPYKVVWKEMSGSGFVAAYVGTSEIAGHTKVVVPDHKVYFVPLQSEDEAAYLTAFLNSAKVSAAVDAYASALSLGTSVTEYFGIPKYDPTNPDMATLAAMAKHFSQGNTPTPSNETELDRLVSSVIATP